MVQHKELHLTEVPSKHVDFVHILHRSILTQVAQFVATTIFLEIFSAGRWVPRRLYFSCLNAKRLVSSPLSTLKKADCVVVERSAFDEAVLLPIIQACSSGHATARSRENVSRIERWSSPIERNVGRDSGRLLGLASSGNPNASVSSERQKARRSRFIRNCNSSIIETNSRRSGSRSTRRMFVSKINSNSAERGWHWS